MKLKRFKKRNFLKFREQLRDLPDSLKYIDTANTWAVMMEHRIKNGQLSGKETPDMLFQKIEDYTLVHYSEFEKAYISSILIRYWKYGRKFQKWYNAQRHFSRTKLIIKV